MRSRALRWLAGLLDKGSKRLLSWANKPSEGLEPDGPVENGDGQSVIYEPAQHDNNRRLVVVPTLPRGLTGSLFERARMIGTQGRELCLETRGARTGKPRRIGNEMGLDRVEAGQEQKFRDMVQKYGWTLRRGPTGAYNCAGHVWAARRTGIFESAEWNKILDDDGYRKLDGGETPRAGDLVIYRFRQDDDFIHVAEVVAVRNDKITVLSKLDATSGEVLHQPGNVPYAEQQLGAFYFDYWTERPRDTAPRLL